MTRLVCVVFALLQWSLTSAAKSEIHTQMSAEEIQRIFHVDSHEQVPEYEVVHIRSVVRRSSEGETRDVHLTAFGNNYQLRLERNDHLIRPGNGVRVWVADSANGSDTASLHDGITLEELPQEDIGVIYQDVEGEAALLVNHDPQDDALVMDGTIGSDLVIRPVPSKLRKSAGVQLHSGSSDDEMFMDEDDFRSSNIMNAPHNYFPAANDTENLIRRRRSTADHHSIGAHIIYKRELLPSESDYEFMEPDLPPTRKPRSPRHKREAPPTIYPEILVIVDYDGYRLHGGDNTEIKKYFVSFWNGVDLRYKLLKGPKVRISIAGIIISRGRDATPYFEKNRVGRNAIDSTAALTDMGKYLFRERRLPVYDIAVAITKLDMCRREFPADECNRGTAGFAYVGGACVVNKRLEKVNSVAIVEDTGGFSGIIVAAHEVGHLLGSVHDGSPPPSYLGGPGAQRCRWEDGYIMSDLRHTERGFKWSHCSIAQFNHFLNGETASCLYNSPHEEAVLPRLLPGKLLSLDAQCRMDRGTSACFKDERVCAQLFCFDASSGYCVSYRPAAEGSPCGDGQICVNGRCVLENENSIPDYAEDIGFNSFLRRTDALPAATEPRPFFTRPAFPGLDATTPTTTTTTTTTTPRTTTTTTTTFRTTTTTTTTTTPRPVTTSKSVPWWHTSTKSTTRFPPWYQWTKRFSPAAGLPETTTTTTPSTTTSTTTTTTTTLRPFENETPFGKLSSSSSGGNDICEDRITKIAGSMSCQDFLQRYGFQYCKQPYIIKNCCASQRKYCPN